jgi:dTDP-4-amino-4,6-dideoxygalactose transaminase
VIPRFRPLIERAELVAMLSRGGADDRARFEAAFAQAIGSRHAIAFPYGRTALRLLLESRGIVGREVIMPAYTCVVVAHAVVASGNRPVFIDCGADGNMDLDLAEQAMSANTAAIVPTSVFGHSVDLDRLDALRTRHPGVLVIQDCAHSFTCEWHGRAVARAGHAAFFGCNISKVATSIFGGMVTTDDPDLATALRGARDLRLSRPGPARAFSQALYAFGAALAFHPSFYSLTDALRRTGMLTRLERYYDEQTIEMPADHLVDITRLQARVGAVQIGRLGDFIAARRRYAHYYHERLEAHPGIRFLPASHGSSYSHVAALVDDRERICARAHARGVELGRVIDYCIPSMPSYASVPQGRAWPRACHFSRHVVNLPLWGRFEEAVANRVVSCVVDALSGAAHAPQIA